MAIINPLISFTPFTIAIPQDVNSNFEALRLGHNDQELVLGSLSVDISNLQSDITDLENDLLLKQDNITGAASTITSTDLTANRVVVSDATGKIDDSTITTTILGYLSGVSSDIQTQINGKADVTHNHSGVYVNVADQFVIIASNSLSTSGYTNIVGSFSNAANYFDVFPPVGYTMANLVGFLPSIWQLHFAGDVGGNDSIRCEGQILGDRIRVFVQNTEQRGTPGAYYISIWRI